MCDDAGCFMKKVIQRYILHFYPFYFSVSEEV